MHSMLSIDLIDVITSTNSIQYAYLQAKYNLQDKLSNMSLTEFAMLFEPFYQKKASETEEIVDHDAYKLIKRL